MTTKNSTVIAIRLPDQAVAILEERARAKGCDSVGEYLKGQIMKTLEKTAASVTTAQSVPRPIYDWHIHKGGEKVRRLVGREWVEFIAPEIDGDGRQVN